MKDKQGREYAKLSELKAGDFVEVDGGFECMKGRKKVQKDESGELWVECDMGEHYLEGQRDYNDEDTLIGIYKL